MLSYASLCTKLLSTFVFTVFDIAVLRYWSRKNVYVYFQCTYDMYTSCICTYLKTQRDISATLSFQNIPILILFVSKRILLYRSIVTAYKVRRNNLSLAQVHNGYNRTKEIIYSSYQISPPVGTSRLNISVCEKMRVLLQTSQHILWKNGRGDF